MLLKKTVKVEALTDEQIAQLESKGWSRWTKAGHDRLYFNIEDSGLIEIDRYKSGNISKSLLKGEKISHSHAGSLLGVNIYIDLTTNKMIAFGEEDAVRELIDLANEVIDSLHEVKVDEAETAKNADTTDKAEKADKADNEAVAYKYYSTLRPLSPGAYPSGLKPLGVENFNFKWEVEPGLRAWGYIVFPTPLSHDDQYTYDLVPAKSNKDSNK